MAHNRPTVSARVVESVARSKDVDPTALPPLLEVIDPDALDALFARASDGVGGGARGVIEFDYAGRRVRVDAAGDVDVR